MISAESKLERSIQYKERDLREERRDTQLKLSKCKR